MQFVYLIGLKDCPAQGLIQWHNLQASWTNYKLRKQVATVDLAFVTAPI